MDLMLAKSKAGHDIKKVYVVVREEDEYLYLANGTTKLLSNPKKKKIIHLLKFSCFITVTFLQAHAMLALF